MKKINYLLAIILFAVFMCDTEMSVLKSNAQNTVYKINNKTFWTISDATVTVVTILTPSLSVAPFIEYKKNGVNMFKIDANGNTDNAGGLSVGGNPLGHEMLNVNGDIVLNTNSILNAGNDNLINSAVIFTGFQTNVGNSKDKTVIAGSSCFITPTLSASGITLSSLTASRAVALDANSNLSASATTATELGYVSGVTSAIQTQLNTINTGSVSVHAGANITVTGTKSYTVGFTPVTNGALLYGGATGSISENFDSLNWNNTNYELHVGGNIYATRGITSTSYSHGIGYSGTAALNGGVTQATSRTTAVTLNNICGRITTNNASLAAGAEAKFTCNNTTVQATDVIILSCSSGQTANTSMAFVSKVSNNSFEITLTNLHASTADTGAMVINFAVIKVPSIIIQ